MAKILKFTQSADYYFNKGVEYKEQGNFVDAIDSFYTVIKLEPKNPYNYVELGYAYTDAQLYREGADAFLKALALDKNIETVYIGLMQCFSEMGNIDLGFYYFKLGVENGVVEEDSLDEIVEIVENKRPRLRLYDDLAGETIVKNARRMMASGQNAVARSMLEEVESKNKSYADAQNSLAYLSYLEKEYEKCVQISVERLAENENDNQALSNAVLAYHELGDSEKEREFSSRLVSVVDAFDKNYDDKTIYRIASAFMRVDSSELALRYYERLLEKNPYDSQALLVYSLCLYNLSRYEEAKKYIVMLRKVYPNNLSVKYYARHIINKDNEHIPLGEVIPLGEHERRKHRVHEAFSLLSEVDKVVERLDEDEELRDMVVWMFDIEEYNLCRVMAEFLGQHPTWQKFLRERLLTAFGSPFLKRYYLTALLLYSGDKKITVSFDGKLRTIIPSAPKFDSYKLERIYWIAYSGAIACGVKNISKLKKAFLDIQQRIVDSGFDLENADERALSAIVANESQLCDEFKSFFNLGTFFDCEDEKIKEYADALGVEKKLDALSKYLEQVFADAQKAMENITSESENNEGEEKND